jgi:hypothetical protein
VQDNQEQGQRDSQTNLDRPQIALLTHARASIENHR